MTRKLMAMALALAVTMAMVVGIPAGADVDNTAPTVAVTPADGATVEVGPGDSFVWTVDAFDDNALVELEVDNSIEAIVPQFTVIADEADPYDGLEALYASFGATVTYDADAQTWVISFGDFTQDILNNGGIEFYIEVNDDHGNFFGDMFNVTDENTFTYTFEKGPYNKDSCKKGGWANFEDAQDFRNQGQCVSYVNLRDK